MRCPAILLDQQHLHYFICTAPVDREEHRTNYILLLKVLILCYFSTQEIGERIGSSSIPWRRISHSHESPDAYIAGAQGRESDFNLESLRSVCNDYVLSRVEHGSSKQT
ncbi:uncharacterized protein P174DRAFT_60674 [Aspergillus novofumigatus IBT 16806]|uniref:Uncharacterized protein n=1 Tax=Aspergillus novofumigatus (strain IBT 16806) TaxID=1392255 RepID=A0A2I1BUB4_ASPN1|nr:uncharacterized protein P174DRAFT_60674 [Aspergillus novofumigatus IBT 16806]PKX88942.1 hypothetical protein P174DRAFT_60674 [Aspergillus novofumigatus IBT 16806]